ncbi:uncharacterized protein VP01_3235g1 [Puccinia sorghi]|uniref:MULE transposase domain-containing protein n=1 Tax=Puccinia sorghi TaxID=27349 RepID=A0A0L6UY85_9BASI|nr:uncharacterized protein VP01_3235g1 [Puccinia sorghi]
MQQPSISSSSHQYTSPTHLVALTWNPFKENFNKQHILDCLLFHDVQKQRRISLGFKKVFITDHKTTLHKALNCVFLDSNIHLFSWHIRKNITKNCKEHFPPGDSTSWEQFMNLKAIRTQAISLQAAVFYRKSLKLNSASKGETSCWLVQLFPSSQDFMHLTFWKSLYHEGLHPK